MLRVSKSFLVFKGALLVAVVVLLTALPMRYDGRDLNHMLLFLVPYGAALILRTYRTMQVPPLGCANPPPTPGGWSSRVSSVGMTPLLNSRNTSKQCHFERGCHGDRVEKPALFCGEMWRQRGITRIRVHYHRALKPHHLHSSRDTGEAVSSLSHLLRAACDSIGER